MLRPYQVVALEEFHKFMQTSSEMGMIVFPTGAGKTLTTLTIMDSMPMKRFIFAVPYIFLAEQTVEGRDDLGLWYGAKKKNLQSKDWVMVIQTLINRVESGEILLNGFDAIFVDEFHQHNKEWKEGQPKNMDWLIRKAKEAGCKVVGLTGTPYDKDGHPLILSKGATLITSDEWRDIKRYVKEKYLCDLIYKVTGHIDQSILKPSSGENNFTAESEEEAILASGVDEVKIIQDNLIGQGLVVCKDINHTIELKKNLELNTNLRVGVIHSKVSQLHKDKNVHEELAKFKRGEYDLLLSVDMLTTGVDIPNATTLFIARVIGSQSMWRQIIGRVLRRPKGKTVGYVIDMYNTIGILGGHPLDPPRPKEKAQREKREPKDCPNCNNPLQRETINITIDEKRGVKIITKACVHCGDEKKEEVYLDGEECDECNLFFLIKETYTSKGWLCTRCDCGAEKKLDKLMNPSLLVAYRDREDAIKTAKLFYKEKFKEEAKKEDLEAIKGFIMVQSRNNIASLLEYLGNFNDVSYSVSSVKKVMDRVRKVNRDFNQSSDIRDVKIKLAIKLGFSHLVDEIDKAFEMAEEFETNITPSYKKLEELKSRKTRSFEAHLRTWFRKETK